MGRVGIILRSRTTTFCAIGIVACTSADMVHEVLGHITAAWIVGDGILSLSTVAIQNVYASRTVSAAGTLANVVVGLIALVLFSRTGGRSGWRYFVAVFSAFNLLNSGYLVASAILQSGDWAAVIQGLSPPWEWRSMLGLVGAIAYVLSMRGLSRSMAALVERNEASLPDLRSLIVASYWAGGAVMTAASVFNPISPRLILISGVGASFVMSAGFLALPGMIARQLRRKRVPASPAASTPLSPLWIGMAIAWGVVFVAIFGPGIHFHP